MLKKKLLISLFPKNYIKMREIHTFNDEWSFHLGDIKDGQSPDLDDELWQILDLPHDWSLEGRFQEFRDEICRNWKNCRLDELAQLAKCQ